MKKIFFIFTIVFSIFFISACGTVESTETFDKPQVLTFVNPAGSPCQQQMKILDSEIIPQFQNIDFKYVKTTDSSSQKDFYKYGIRHIPAIVILNKDGTVFKSLPAGVQPKEAIFSILSSL